MLDVFTFVLLVVIFGCGLLGGWIASRHGMVSPAVASAAAVLIRDLVAALADGHLTPDEVRGLVARALAMVKELTATANYAGEEAGIR